MRASLCAASHRLWPPEGSADNLHGAEGPRTARPLGHRGSARKRRPHPNDPPVPPPLKLTPSVPLLFTSPVTVSTDAFSRPKVPELSRLPVIASVVPLES